MREANGFRFDSLFQLDMANLPAICIVAQKAYGALMGGGKGHIGGIERQTSLTAKWLAGNGYPTTIITWDEGGRECSFIDGVRLLKICPEQAGIPGIRFFHPRWSGLIHSLKQADSDIYYQNGAECSTGQVALWCRLHRKRFVFSSAADADVRSDLPAFSGWRDRWFYRYGLRHADLVIVQTSIQAGLLKEGFGLQSTVMPMPCPDLAAETYTPELPKKPRVVWVGRITSVKRLELLLDVARASPDINFEIAGPPGERPYSDQVCDQARKLPNVFLRGPVAREDIADFYKGSTCLCCTSIREGFPNTFLEAWSLGIPVIATLDVDNLLTQRGLGFYAPTVSDLISQLHKLASSDQIWRDVSQRAQAYFKETHCAERVLPRFASLLTRTIQEQ